MNHALVSLLTLSLCASVFAEDSPKQAGIIKVIHDTEPQRHQSMLERVIAPNETGKFRHLREDFAPKPDGEYITAIWKTYARGPLRNVTVRLFYRQTNFPQPQTASIQMDNVKSGTTYSSFQIIGDAFAKGGPITAWKVEVTADGKTLDSFRSFLWKEPS